MTDKEYLQKVEKRRLIREVLESDRKRHGKRHNRKKQKKEMNQ